MSTLPDTLQRGQHAAAGLGTGPHDPSVGQHDAVRCWLGLGSNDPLRCGLNSAHPTLAMRNLLKFAKIPQGMHYAALLLHSSASPRSTLQTPCRLPSCGLVPRLGGLGHQIFCRSSLPFQGGCIRSQLRSRLPDGGRMSSGSVVCSRWVQAPCRHSLIFCRGASMPVLG